MRSLSSSGFLDRGRLWLQLVDQVKDPAVQPLAYAIAEHLDSLYVENAVAVYGNGVEDGRQLGSEQSANVVTMLRQQIAALDKSVRVMTGAEPECAPPITH